MSASVSGPGVDPALLAPAELEPQDRMLILLRDELYEGRWDLMRQDLLDRLNGRPYIFKLANRIQDDLERIERLQRAPAPSSADAVPRGH